MALTIGLNIFDRLHHGHRFLIEKLRNMPNPVVGITDGDLISKNLELREIIQPVDFRERNLRDYLATANHLEHISVAEFSSYKDLLNIEDKCTFVLFDGPCCKEIEIRALAIRFKQMGIKDELVKLTPVRALDGGKISSARIRKGEIDREGNPLRGTTEPARKLPESNRDGLKSPKGELFSVRDGRPEVAVVKKLEKEEPPCVIAVGDVTSVTLIREGFTPDVCVVDGITKRGSYDAQLVGEKEYVIYNPPAMLYPEAWSTMATALEDGYRSIITVEGEEDLMGFPAVLLAKEGSVMLYGQPDEGIVWVPVTEDNQRIANEFLQMMPIIE